MKVFIWIHFIMPIIYLIAHQQQVFPQQEVLQHVLHNHHVLQ